MEQRYRALFDQWYSRVLAYALRRLGSRTAAEDVVAETFLVTWRRIGDVPAGPDALPWLLGVARRVSTNARRGDSRRERLLARLGHLHRPEAAPPPEEVLDLDDRHRAVREAMQRLPSPHAEVLHLAIWEQLSHAQIGLVLDCSANAVGIRLHRARQALRQELERGTTPAGHRSTRTGTEPPGDHGA